MNRDDIIRMAREAGISKPWDQEPIKWETLICFANLVAAAEQEKMKWEGIHTCNTDCQNPVCIAVREAVAAEREACALEVEKAGIEGYGTLAAAAAIRARGQA